MVMVVWWGNLVDMTVARKKRKGEIGAQLLPHTVHVCLGGVAVPGEWYCPYSDKSSPSIHQ